MDRGRIENYLWPIVWEPYKMDVPYGDFPVVYGVAALCAANAELRYACEQAWEYVGDIPIEEVPSVTDRRDVLSDIKTALENSTRRVMDARVEASHPMVAEHVLRMWHGDPEARGEFEGLLAILERGGGL